jgi:hypothetical protein
MGEVPGPQDLSQVPVVCSVCHQVHEPRERFNAFTDAMMHA